MCDIEIYSYIESWFCCGNHESPPGCKRTKSPKNTPPQSIYHRVSMLLPTEEFSFHKTMDHLFPKSEVSYAREHNTEHAILPYVITKDGHMFQDKRARKKN
jgi:hypothetical protein